MLCSSASRGFVSNRCGRKAAHPALPHFNVPAAPIRGRPQLLQTRCASTSKGDNTSTSSAPTVTSSSSPEGSVPQQLLTREQQALAFTALAGSSALFGLVAIAAPEQLIQFAVGVPATPLDVAFAQVAGSTMAISAAAEYSLQDAAVKGNMGSATYQRLMLGIIAKSSLYLLAFTLSPDLWNPVLLALFPTAAVASIAINTATLSSCLAASSSSSEGRSSSSSSSSSSSALLALLPELKVPKTSAGWVYSVFVLLYLATVAACYAPEVMFIGEVTPVGSLLKHIWAPGFLLCAVVCYIQKDAADRGRLGASTFMKLNAGLASVELGYSLVTVSSILGGLMVNDGSSWSNLVGSVFFTGYCLVQLSSVFSKWVVP